MGLKRGRGRGARLSGSASLMEGAEPALRQLPVQCDRSAREAVLHGVQTNPPGPGGPISGGCGSQGRLPGGGGPGAHTVLGGRATEGWEEEEAGAPSTPASVWARAGAWLGHGSLVRWGSEPQLRCLPGCVGIGGSRAGWHAPSEEVTWACPFTPAQSLSAAEGAGETASEGRLGAVPGAACVRAVCPPCTCLRSTRPRWSRSRTTRRTRRCTGTSSSTAA